MTINENLFYNIQFKCEDEYKIKYDGLRKELKGKVK